MGPCFVASRSLFLVYLWTTLNSFLRRTSGLNNMNKEEGKQQDQLNK